MIFIFYSSISLNSISKKIFYHQIVGNIETHILVLVALCWDKNLHRYHKKKNKKTQLGLKPIREGRTQKLRNTLILVIV